MSAVSVHGPRDSSVYGRPASASHVAYGMTGTSGSAAANRSPIPSRPCIDGRCDHGCCTAVVSTSLTPLPGSCASSFFAFASEFSADVLPATATTSMRPNFSRFARMCASATASSSP